jgi:hypothetical protein
MVLAGNRVQRLFGNSHAEPSGSSGGMLGKYHCEFINLDVHI